MKQIPKISVMIITYKQEELIKRAINSLLSQKDYIYEICVSDDCSPDNTWKVLKEYEKEYPGLFKLQRNNPNVGYFENLERAWSMATGDLGYILAGDDECGEGWLIKVIDFIQENNIDYLHEAFCVYGDYKAIYPNGDTFVFNNKAILGKHNPMGLSLRKKICNRSVVFSKEVYSKFINVAEGRSYEVESGQDMQMQIFSKKNYYIPMVGNIYYAAIGISTGKDRHEEKGKSTPAECIKKVMKEGHYKIPKKDERLLDYFQERALLRRYKTNDDGSYNSWQYLVRKIRLSFIYLSSIDLSTGITVHKPRRILFAIRHRLPHNHPIHGRC